MKPIPSVCTVLFVELLSFVKCVEADEPPMGKPSRSEGRFADSILFCYAIGLRVATPSSLDRLSLLRGIFGPITRIEVGGVSCFCVSMPLWV